MEWEAIIVLFHYFFHVLNFSFHEFILFIYETYRLLQLVESFSNPLLHLLSPHWLFHFHKTGNGLWSAVWSFLWAHFQLKDGCLWISWLVAHVHVVQGHHYTGSPRRLNFAPTISYKVPSTERNNSSVRTDNIQLQISSTDEKWIHCNFSFPCYQIICFWYSLHQTEVL